MKLNRLFNILYSIYFLTNFSHSVSNKIYINSIPKCGTHLLTKCLELITEKKARGFPTLKINESLHTIKDNEFFFSHMPYTIAFEEKLKNQNFKTFFIYRDPRDQLVSAASWIIEKNKRFEPYGFNTAPSFDQMLDLLISNVEKVYNSFLPWMNNQSVCSIKFENLIGLQGGGNLMNQVNELKKICNFLDIKNPQISHYINNIFGGTGTFRKGQIGNWKKYFTKKQKREFKKIAGQLLIDLGYEQNFEW